MRITDTLKPVTDALASVGVSLGTVTYKDGKIHAELIVGPEHPPEGYRLMASVVPGSSAEVPRNIPVEGITWTDHQQVYLVGYGWCSHREVRKHLKTPRGAKVLAIAVPITKPEPVKLTDQEKIVGWRGPTGFRLQTFQSRKVPCAVCKKMIQAGERMARWRTKFPETGDNDHVCGKPGSEENHSHAHVNCLYEISIGFRGTSGVHGSLDYDKDAVPTWLQEKRRKYNEQHGTP